jgi:hypothetical protein
MQPTFATRGAWLAVSLVDDRHVITLTRAVVGMGDVCVIQIVDEADVICARITLIRI